MRFREVVPGVYRASRRATNVYLVDQGSYSVLIDTGEPSFAPSILKALSGFPPVRQILLTHAHYDHAGSASDLSRELKAEVFAHPADADLVKHGKWRRPATPAPTVIGHLFTRLIANRFPDHIDAVPGIRDIDGEGEMAIAGLKTIELPGHSSGQIGFGIPQSSGNTVWIIGDVVMTAASISEPILFEDRLLGLTSVSTLAERIQRGDLICPGHGAPRNVDINTIKRLRRIAAR